MLRLVSVTVVLFSLLAIAPNASATWRSHECRFGSFPRVREVKHTIWCAADKFNVSKRRALYVAYRESRFYPKARNTSSGACGLFQHLPQYWPGRRANVAPHWGPMSHSCFNARSNVFATVTYIKHNGWSAWGY